MNSMSFADHPVSDILMPETSIQIQKCCKVPLLWGGLQNRYIIARVSSFQQAFFYSSWETWLQWVLLISFRYFDDRNQNSNSEVLQSSTVGRFSKQIYFNLSTWSLADQSWVQNNIVISISGQIGFFSIYFNMHEIHSEIYLSHLMVLPFTNT